MIPMPVNTQAHDFLITASGSNSTRSLGSTTEAFKDALSKVDPSARREVARESATQLVSTAFILPVLEDMQEGLFRGDMFAANSVEKRFAPLLNQRIADNIATASNFPLIDALVNHLVGPELSDDEAPEEVIDVKA